MNHATELFNVDLNGGSMKALTHANDATYSNIAMSETKLRMVKTSDGKEMGVWVIYPPNFDPSKNILLYCTARVGLNLRLLNFTACAGIFS